MCVVMSDGTISKHQKDILKAQSESYFKKKLYTADVNIQFTFLNNSDKKLSEEEKKNSILQLI